MNIPKHSIDCKKSGCSIRLNFNVGPENLLSCLPFSENFNKHNHKNSFDFFESLKKTVANMKSGEKTNPEFAYSPRLFIVSSKEFDDPITVYELFCDRSFAVDETQFTKIQSPVFATLCKKNGADGRIEIQEIYSLKDDELKCFVYFMQTRADLVLKTLRLQTDTCKIDLLEKSICNRSPLRFKMDYTPIDLREISLALSLKYNATVNLSSSKILSNVSDTEIMGAYNVLKESPSRAVLQYDIERLLINAVDSGNILNETAAMDIIRLLNKLCFEIGKSRKKGNVDNISVKNKNFINKLLTNKIFFFSKIGSKLKIKKKNIGTIPGFYDLKNTAIGLIINGLRNGSLEVTKSRHKLKKTSFDNIRSLNAFSKYGLNIRNHNSLIEIKIAFDTFEEICAFKCDNNSKEALFKFTEESLADEDLVISCLFKIFDRDYFTSHIGKKQDFLSLGLLFRDLDKGFNVRTVTLGENDFVLWNILLEYGLVINDGKFQLTNLGRYFYVRFLKDESTKISNINIKNEFSKNK